MFLHFRFGTPSTDGHNSDRERPEIVEWRNQYVRDVIKAREDGKNIVSTTRQSLSAYNIT